MKEHRSLFPVTEKYVYLDHAGIAPISVPVRDAIERCAREASEMAAFSYPAWSRRIEEARSRSAELVHAMPSEIAFVKNTSHGISIVASGLEWREGDNVLVIAGEFPSNLFPWMVLQEKGIDVRMIATREGRVLIEDIATRMDSRTRLVAISSVQFANGYRVDLERLGSQCRSRGVLLFVDAIQSLGVLPMDVVRSHVDFLAADAHKWMLGPEGIGIFYCRSGLAEQLKPPLIGWKSVENEMSFDRPELALKLDARRFEEGTQNLLGIAGLGAAVELLLEVGVARIAQQVLDLGDKILDEAERRRFTALTPRNREERGGNVTISGPFDPVVLRDRLRERGIMVNARGGGLRISPHFYTNEDEIEVCFQEMDRIRAS